MMKKIMTLVAVAMAACAVNAAAFTWANTGTKTAGTIYDYTGTKLASGTVAYLIDAATISQADIVTAFRAGTDVTANAIAGANATLNTSSKIAATGFTYGTAGNDYDFYYVIVDSANQQLLVSSLVEGNAAQASDTTAVSFTGSTTWSKNAFDGNTAYSGAGWYAAAPEPTSGLLLLLGMAGLALKRKRA